MTSGLPYFIYKIQKSKILENSKFFGCKTATRYTQIHPESLVEIRLVVSGEKPDDDAEDDDDEEDAIFNSGNLTTEKISKLYLHVYTYIKVGKGQNLYLQSCFAALSRTGSKWLYNQNI